jgi:hypothetical protein
MQLRWLVAVSIVSLSGAWPAAARHAVVHDSASADAASAESIDPSQWRGVTLARALSVAETIADPYRRAESLASIAQAQVIGTDTAAADQTIHLALAAAEQVPEAAFRGWVLQEIVLAQVAAEDLFGARQTANRIEATRPQGAALAVIAEVELRGGNVQAALATARQIRERGDASEVLRQVVAVHAGRGEISAARELLKRIEEPFYRALASGDVAVSEILRGNVASAIALAARVKKTQRAQVYGRIALALVEAGDAAGAAQALQKVDDALYLATVRGRFAAGRAEAGDGEGARELFASAISEATSTPGNPYRRIFAVAQLGHLQADSDPAGASETLQWARAEAEKLPAGKHRDEAIEYVARGQARVGDAAAALRAAPQMTDRVARALLVRDVVALQPDATSAYASASAASFEDPLIETAAQFGLLGVQLLKGGQPMLAGTIEAACAAVRRIDDQRLKPAAFSALAVARVKIGDVAASRAIFQEALAAAEAISRADQRAAAYVRIANALNDRLMFLGQPVSSGADTK